VVAALLTLGDGRKKANQAATTAHAAQAQAPDPIEAERAEAQRVASAQLPLLEAAKAAGELVEITTEPELPRGIQVELPNVTGTATFFKALQVGENQFAAVAVHGISLLVPLDDVTVGAEVVAHQHRQRLKHGFAAGQPVRVVSCIPGRAARNGVVERVFPGDGLASVRIDGDAQAGLYQLGELEVKDNSNAFRDPLREERERHEARKALQAASDQADQVIREAAKAFEESAEGTPPEVREALAAAGVKVSR
jgi:hypothetical protein